MKFISLLESLRPKPEFWALFKDVLRDVWKAKNASKLESAEILKKRMAELNIFKNKLVQLYVNGKLKEVHYNEQMEKVEGELAGLMQQEAEQLPTGVELEQVMEFARWMLENAGVTWLAAEPYKKGILQTAFFPNGLAFGPEGFRTPTSISLLKELEANTDDQIGLASPRGFEPLLSP